MSARLQGRTVLVTGATGIGAATARRAAEEGASVFVVALEAREVDSLVDELRGDGRRADGVVADLREESGTEEAFRRCGESLGPPDGVAAVAGGSGRRHGDGPLHEIPLEGWDATVQMNMTPMFLTVREAVRAMRGTGGAVVIISSVLASHPSELFVTHAYAAAKSAALGFTRSAASRYATESIRINVVAPGLVETPMSRRPAEDPTTTGYAQRKQPLAKGFLPAASVAAATTFLLSDDARHVTGQVLEVDGGWGVTEAQP